MLSGSYFTAIGILVLFILISAVRQIVEPKIVSTSLGIHPVMTLLAIFIGLKAFGFAGMIYLTFLMVFYKVLKNSKIL
jgi:predicted PurR-regulated permease PerM